MSICPLRKTHIWTRVIAADRIRLFSESVAALADVFGEGGEEFLALDGLGGIVVAAGVEAFLAIAGHGMGRERHYPTGVTFFAQGDGGFITVHDRHLHVHEDEVEGLAGFSGGSCGVYGLFAVIDDCHFGAGFLKDMCDQSLVVRAVFGQQDPSGQQNGGGYLRSDCSMFAPSWKVSRLGISNMPTPSIEPVAMVTRK